MNVPRILILSFIILSCSISSAQKKAAATRIDVGVAKIDITPYGPIRLSGYLRWGNRGHESEGVLQQLWAKAIAFGSDTQNPSVIITVDLAGIQAYEVEAVEKYLASKTKFKAGNLSICASHTHSGPDMGNSHNMYFRPPLPTEQVARIAAYLDSLTLKLQKVALEALNNRKPSLISWGIGEVDFALNRRVIKNGVWVGHGKVPEGPVDHRLPMMKIADADGKLKAIFVNYACHGTTLLDNINKTHGDWIGDAQVAIESHHPGIIAMVAQGCAGDSDPDLRGTLEISKQHGETIAKEVDRLLATSLRPINQPPSVRVKKIQLPFDHVPDVKEFTELSKDTTAKGHNAEVYLDRIVRGIPIDSSLTYPIECWTFGKDLAMLFMAGEVLADYSVRIRKEFSDSIWINAYTNDVKAYIPSARSIKEGGYEVEGNMYYYDHPFHFATSIEETIMQALHNIVPANFQFKTLKKNAIM